MQCPDYESQRFYVNDPEDQFNIFEFDLNEGRIAYSGKESEFDPLKIVDVTGNLL